MIKNMLLIFLSLFLAAQIVYAAPQGLLFTSVSEPVAVTALDSYSKMGQAKAIGLLGLFAFGDASTEAAAQQAGISAIHHVDRHCFNLLFNIFTLETTKVYGK